MREYAYHNVFACMARVIIRCHSELNQGTATVSVVYELALLGPPANVSHGSGEGVPGDRLQPSSPFNHSLRMAILILSASSMYCSLRAATLSPLVSLRRRGPSIS